MLVLNIRETAKVTCSCGNWLSHWAKFGGGITTAICSANGCCKLASVGAHIRIDGRVSDGKVVDGKVLIVPMCERHQQQDYPVDVYEHTVGVSADLAKTCARPTLVELGLGALVGIPPHRYQSSLGVSGSLADIPYVGGEARPEPVEGVAELLSGPALRPRHKRSW